MAIDGLMHDSITRGDNPSLRIDLLLHDKSQFGVLGHLTKKLMEALERKGVECRLLSLDGNLQKLKQTIISGGADYTLCFNGVLPDEEGNFLCDQLDIPHIAYIVDSANQYYPLVKSPNTILVGVDQNACDMFRGFQASDVLFLPHAVEPELAPDKSLKRQYEVVMFSSCIEHEKIQEEWRKAYSPEWAAVLDEAVELALRPTEESYIDALTQAIAGAQVDPKEVDLIEAMTAVEWVSRARERIALVNALEGFPVHIFGSGPWKGKINNKNVLLHDPLEYEQTLEVMKQSQVVLNSCLWIKRGGHERLFAAMACGAVGVTNRNAYLDKFFQQERDILYYDCQFWDRLNPKIEKCLQDEEYRASVALAGREIVMQNHTWDHRASVLTDYLQSRQ